MASQSDAGLHTALYTSERMSQNHLFETNYESHERNANELNHDAEH